jgi:intracellular septation protein
MINAASSRLSILVLSLFHFVIKKNFLKTMLGSQVNLPDAKWQTLSVSWIAYCVFMATTNAYVAYEFSTDDWVNFKIWGYIFPLIFIVGTGFYIAKHVPPAENAANDESVK